MTDTGLSTDTVVATDSGPVTLIDLPTLRSRIEARQGESRAKLEEAKSLRGLANDRHVELGQLLLDNANRWTPTPAITDLLNQAQSIRERIRADEAALKAIHDKERHGISGLVGRISDRNEERKASSDEAMLQPQLHGVLTQIALSAPAVDFEPALNVSTQARAASEQADQLEADAKISTDRLAGLEDERNRRESAQREMGFDAPYLAAYLKTYGPQPVEGPLNLKRGERAIAVVPARLARQQTRTRWVGGSRGVSFPLGHTGIRYRVGSYHGHPIQQQVLTTVDEGSLEITNQRIAFIGRAKSTSTTLEKLIHVECYSDALAVFREGRENPDFFLMERPQYALFMLNWATDQT